MRHLQGSSADFKELLGHSFTELRGHVDLRISSGVFSMSSAGNSCSNRSFPYVCRSGKRVLPFNRNGGSFAIFLCPPRTNERMNLGVRPVISPVAALVAPSRTKRTLIFVVDASRRSSLTRGSSPVAPLVVLGHDVRRPRVGSVDDLPSTPELSTPAPRHRSRSSSRHQPLRWPPILSIVAAFSILVFLPRPHLQL